MYGFCCRSISKVVTMIHGFNREVVGGIEKPRFSPDVSASPGFHIVRGTPSICITTQKHKKTQHVRLAKRRNIINAIFKTQN